MLRVLEPEVMDTEGEAKEYDAMDFRAPNDRFALDALALLGDVPHAKVLDIGTGTGQIPLLLLQKKPDLEILAIDLADEMLKIATKRLEEAGFADRCKFTRMDAKRLLVATEAYDLVICNSLIHHIPKPIEAFFEIARVVKPNGAILVRDLVRPASTDDAHKIVKDAAAGDSERQRKLFFDSLCAGLEIEEVERLAGSAGLDDVRVSRVSDRHWSLERARS